MQALFSPYDFSGNLTVFHNLNDRSMIPGFSIPTWWREDLPLHNGEVVVTIPKFIFLYCLEAEFIRKFSEQNCWRKLIFQFVHKICNVKALESLVPVKSQMCNNITCAVFPSRLHLIDFWGFSLEQICIHRANPSCETPILPHMFISFHQQG